MRGRKTGSDPRAQSIVNATTATLTSPASPTFTLAADDSSSLSSVLPLFTFFPTSTTASSPPVAAALDADATRELTPESAR